MSKGRVSAGRRLLIALHGLAHYLWRYQVAPLIKVAALLRRIWALGTPERAVLVGTIGLSLIAAGTLTSDSAGADTARSAAHLGLFVLIWSVTLATAAAQPGPTALTVVAPWLVFYIVLVASAWIGTPMMVLPVIWLAWTLFRKLDEVPSRLGATMWWCVAAAGLAYVSAGPSGLRRWLGWTPAGAQVVLGLTLAVAGSAARYLTGAQPRPVMGFSRSMTVAVFVSGTVIGSAAVKDWALTVEWAGQMVGDVAAILVLFWMWIGGSAGSGSLHFSQWCVRLASRVVPARALVVLAPVVVTVVAGIEATQVLQPVSPAAEFGRALLIAHLVVSVAAAVRLGSALVRGRLTRVTAGTWLMWWGLAWLLTQAIGAGAASVIATSTPSSTAAAIVIVVLLVGLVSELGALQRAWTALPDARIRVQLGLLAVTAGCAVVLSTTPDGGWQKARTLMVLMGAAHLAIPIALYERLRPRAAQQQVSPATRAVMFAAGYAAALIVMAVEPRRAAVLFILLPLLAAILVCVRRSAPIGRVGGMFVGALFGSGATAGWMMPYPPTIPFVPVPAWIDLLRNWGALGRAPLTWQHALLIVAAWTLAGGLGWLLFAPRHPPHTRV